MNCEICLDKENLSENTFTETIKNFIASDGHIKCPSDGSSGLGTIQCGFQIQETNGKPPYWSCSEFAQVVSTFSSLILESREKELHG